MADSTIEKPVQRVRCPVGVNEGRAAEILAGLSSGEYGLIEATDLLGLPDAGWTLDLLREAGMWLFTLPAAEIKRQVDEGRDAFRECLRPEIRTKLGALRSGKP